MSQSWYPRLATVSEALRAPLDDLYRHSWPPPGTTIVPVAHPEPWGLVVELEGAQLDLSHVYWTTLDEFVADLDPLAASILLRVAKRWVGPIATAVGVMGHWPVLWDPTIGSVMRWIRTTFRGVLGAGIEQFQFKLDWGNPGSDPTLSEGDAIDYADALATRFKNVWGQTQANGSLAETYRDSTLFTEVGAVSMTQNGSGEDQAQDYPTGWAKYPTGTEPKGGTFGSGANNLPFEVATAVSLLTDTRGPRGRGRCYLPAPATNAMGANGFYSASHYKPAADFIRDLAHAHTLATGHDLIVVSKAAGQLHTVTSVRCGQVPDSQRRRRRSQAEAPYTAAAL